VWQNSQLRKLPARITGARDGAFQESLGMFLHPSSVNMLVSFMQLGFKCRRKTPQKVVPRAW
jgi:hypothetical protein